MLGGYEVVEVLGEGGMSTVYRARATTTGEVLALKVRDVGTSRKAPRRRERFARQVEALRRLDHPGIVRVHASGRLGSWEWLAMDLLEGRDLRQALRSEPLTLRRKLAVLEEVCLAVTHAHERDVIHRDLKPGNVLLDGRDRAFLIDFGLAKLADQEDTLSKPGDHLGTYNYSAPEQIVDPTAVDQRADVFSLGVVLFEMATGQRPFPGDKREARERILHEEPPLPSTLCPSAAALDRVCLNALEKDPSQRYPSVRHLWDAIAQKIGGRDWRPARPAG